MKPRIASYAVGVLLSAAAAGAQNARFSPQEMQKFGNSAAAYEDTKKPDCDTPYGTLAIWRHEPDEEFRIALMNNEWAATAIQRKKDHKPIASDFEIRKSDAVWGHIFLFDYSSGLTAAKEYVLGFTGDWYRPPREEDKSHSSFILKEFQKAIDECSTGERK
ncbi:MAG: hypothetical protein HY517_03370 [Candidatus Aenigmarchaeota archaeon]|nr:hypothetical protein [Candidatus Aenigmarchaeota archaeon]